MNFNPFAENKAPSRSMFAKEREKQIRATTETVEDLEERYGVKEYLGVQMDNEAVIFFKELVNQLGEDDTLEIEKIETTQFDSEGRLTVLDCSNSLITSFPKLPNGLIELSCRNTFLTALPALPAGLTKLNCYKSKINTLPELPSGLEEIYLDGTQITTIRELPTGLKKLVCNNTKISSLPELPAGLELFNCSSTLIALLPELL